MAPVQIEYYDMHTTAFPPGWTDSTDRCTFSFSVLLSIHQLQHDVRDFLCDLRRQINFRASLRSSRGSEALTVQKLKLMIILIGSEGL